jgi:hypothetical protein
MSPGRFRFFALAAGLRLTATDQRCQSLEVQSGEKHMAGRLLAPRIVGRCGSITVVSGLQNCAILSNWLFLKNSQNACIPSRIKLASSSLAFPLYSANRDVATSSSERATLLGIGNGHSRLHIRVVVKGGDPPFASVLHPDRQQACTEASLVIGIRPQKQLLNSGH